MSATDADEDAIYFFLVTLPLRGILYGDPVTGLTYEPDSDYAGDDDFKFLAYDGIALSEIANVIITVKDKEDEKDNVLNIPPRNIHSAHFARVP